MHKLAADLLIGIRNYTELAERIYKLLMRCREASEQQGTSVGDGVLCQVHHQRHHCLGGPKEGGRIAKFPRPKCMKELTG